jgi:hypothetical protein
MVRRRSAIRNPGTPTPIWLGAGRRGKKRSDFRRLAQKPPVEPAEPSNNDDGRKVRNVCASRQERSQAEAANWCLASDLSALSAIGPAYHESIRGKPGRVERCDVAWALGWALIPPVTGCGLDFIIGHANAGERARTDRDTAVRLKPYSW